jgi:cation transport ATPase
MIVKTIALAEDSAVSRMVHLVEEAQTQRSRTEMLVEQVAKYYTPGMRSDPHSFTMVYLRDRLSLDVVATVTVA